MRRDEKRRAMLDAAAQLFGELGFERTSIDAVAARARVSKPTVYSHFSNKEELFRESLADSAETLNRDSYAALTSLRTGSDWEDSLRAAALALSACQRSPCAQALNRQIHAESLRDPQVVALINERVADPTEELLAGKLAILSNSGHLDITDPQLAATQFCAIVFAELPRLTRLGTVEISDADAAVAVDRGVDSFLRMYAPLHATERAAPLG